MTTVHGCSGCATTAGVLGCPTHGGGSGVGQMVALQTMVDNAQACANGFHAWMPWLAIQSPDGVIQGYTTYCVRCRHAEQYDMGDPSHHGRLSGDGR